VSVPRPRHHRGLSPRDSVTRRVLAELDSFTTWLRAHRVRGYLGEFGWPWSRDSAAWNNVARAYFRQLNRQDDLLYSGYAASGHFHTNVLGQYTNTAAFGQARAITRVRPNAVVAEVHSRRDTYSVTVPDPDFGVSSIRAGGVFSNMNPGSLGTDYFYPSPTDLRFLAGRGVKIIRLTFRWERLQPALLGPLSATELGCLTEFLSMIESLGMRAIVTPHNFAGYAVGTDATSVTRHYLAMDTTQPLNVNHLTDFWTRVSGALNGNPALFAYALMNEPTGLRAMSSPYGPNLLDTDTFVSGVRRWRGAGATVGRSAAPVGRGSGSLAWQVTAAGNAGAYSPSFTVMPGIGYAGSCRVRAGTTAREVALSIDWHDGNGTYLSSCSATPVSDSVSSWTPLTVAGVPPHAARSANVTIKAHCSEVGEMSYFDQIWCQTSNVVSASSVWQSLSQAALDAVRANGDTALVMVPGYDFSKVHTWPVNHPAAWIVDRASNVRYEAHHYWDSDHSGNYLLSFGQELSNARTAGY